MSIQASARSGSISPMAATALEMARTACLRRLDDPLLWYFDVPITGRQVARYSDALASALAARGVGAGDRVALLLQNVPALPIATIAAWKLGAIVVPLNPMLREPELVALFADADPSVLICLDEVHVSSAAGALRTVPIDAVLTTSPLDFLDSIPALLSCYSRPRVAGTDDLRSLIARHDGERPSQIAVTPTAAAALMYTSGTTGPSKGATISHRNAAFAASVWAEWVQLDESSVNLALAPLFHVTGLIAGFGASVAAATPLVLAHRFDAAATLSLIERHRPTFTVAAISAYLALMRADGFEEADFSCLSAAFTGGAPVSPQIARDWREATGVSLHNAYGLTETSSPLTLTPLGTREGPVDPTSGALSVGLPAYDTEITILAEDGRALPAGAIGEITASGPQVVDGYWHRPDETARALSGGRLRTGDLGYVNEQGWLFVVDRLKDLIIASGYKIWPREVEEVLLAHTGVREAAVIGIPDDYRGETVKAVVSLAPGCRVEPSELISFCRTRLAAFKCPSVVAIVDELPKTASGKVLRRELRTPEVR